MAHTAAILVFWNLSKRIRRKAAGYVFSLKMGGMSAGLMNDVDNFGQVPCCPACYWARPCLKKQGF